MCGLTLLYVWVDTAICVGWYSHICRLIRIYSLKSDAYRVKKRLRQLVRAPRLRSLAFIAREPCREKEGISIKKIPFIALSWHPRFLFYPFELSLSPINIGWAFTWLILVIYERWICRKYLEATIRQQPRLWLIDKKRNGRHLRRPAQKR